MADVLNIKDRLNLKRGPISDSNAASIANNIVSGGSPTTPLGLKKLNSNFGGNTALGTNGSALSADKTVVNAANNIIKSGGMVYPQKNNPGTGNLNRGNVIESAVKSFRKKYNSAELPASESPYAGNVQPSSNNDVVRIRDYVSPYFDIPLNYDNSSGKVYLGGREVPVTHISDGRTFAKKSDIDKIINEIVSDPFSKYSIAKNIINSREDINNIVNNLSSKEKFSYDVFSDPVYKAYVNQVDALKEQAIRDAVSNSVARTGGYMNSNAAAAAYQVGSQYDEMKSNIIPTLEAQAYNRFNDNRNFNNETQNIIGNLLSNYNNNLISLYNDKNATDLNEYIVDVENEQFNKTHSLEEKVFEFEKEIGARELEEKIRQFNQSYNLSYDQLSLQEKSYLLEKWATEKRLNASYTEPSLSTNNTGNSTRHSGTLVPVS